MLLLPFSCSSPNTASKQLIVELCAALPPITCQATFMESQKRNERIAFSYIIVTFSRLPFQEYPKCLHKSNHLEEVNRVLPILCKENVHFYFDFVRQTLYGGLCFLPMQQCIFLNSEVGFILPGEEWSENIVKPSS